MHFKPFLFQLLKLFFVISNPGVTQSCERKGKLCVLSDNASREMEASARNFFPLLHQSYAIKAWTSSEVKFVSKVKHGGEQLWCVVGASPAGVSWTVAGGDASIIPTNGRQLQVCTSVTSMKTDHRTVRVGLKRKCKAHIPHQDSKRPSKEENDPEEINPDDIQESKQPLSLPLSSSASDGEPSQSPSAKTHLETHALTSAELILKTSAPSNVSPIVCATLNLQVYDIHRTGAKSVPGGLADPLQPGMGYHSTGLLRLKPGRGESTLSLSCSDKMARWGVLGFQGALLFHYLQEALYFSTIVIGKCPFSHEAMQRALITRCSHIADLPAGFSVSQPVFLHSELEFPFSRHQTELQHKEGQGCITPCGAAVSWCKVPEQPLDVTASGFKQGVTKKALGTAKARSALCKLELFHSFLSLVSSTDASALPDSLRRTDLHTYLDYKEASEVYQQAWQLLRNQAFPLWPRSDRDLLLFK